VGASGDLSRRCFLFSRIDPLAKSAIVMLPHPMSILALRGPAGTAGKKAEPAERGDRQFKVLISISLDYCLLPSPLLRLSSAAVDGLTFIMKYPLPSSTITETCVLSSHLSVTVQSWATE
jgi:hypothetical protein